MNYNLKVILLVVVSMLVLTSCALIRTPSEPPTETMTDTPSKTETTDVTTEVTTDEPPVSETSESETTAEENPPEPLPYINPLTGEGIKTDFTTQRPAAIMINNIKISCPQNGVGSADIIYECLAEGGLTRLMMVSMDYQNLPEVGSIRSSRDYFLDFAADYDALYVHAGGSQYAYIAIAERKVQNLDGVNMWFPSTFYQDPDRKKNMGFEHSTMTTGEGIASGIKYKRYRTALTENFDYPLDFVSSDTALTYESKAEHIHIPFSRVQTTDFVYDAESGKYLRYQFDGEKHIDGLTNEQLAFENVLIYFCETGAITGDAKNRIEVGTVGEGTGYYATNGTYTQITWKKESHTAPIKFYGPDGALLLLNVGKTFISVCPTTIESSLSFNYEW